MTCAFYQDRLRVLLWTGHSQVLNPFRPFIITFITCDAAGLIISVVESASPNKLKTISEETYERGLEAKDPRSKFNMAGQGLLLMLPSQGRFKNSNFIVT
jgi:hypothetical protein